MNLLINKIKDGYILYLRGENLDNLKCELCENEEVIKGKIDFFKSNYKIKYIKFGY